MAQNGIHRILVVEDEEVYLRALKSVLEASGYEVITASNGLMAVEAASREAPSLILLDVRMPRMNGIEACRRIREFSQAPIIMITALAQNEDMIKGLEAGADDYITKPFNTDVFLARVSAALRRSSYGDSLAYEPIFQQDDLMVDYVHQQVFVGPQEIHLTSIEYRLLCELTRAKGGIVSHSALLNNVWGPGYESEDRLIHVVVSRLRQKLESGSGSRKYILTRPGLGYYINMT